MLKLLATIAGAVYLSDRERRERLVGTLRERASEYAATADTPAARALREGERALQRAERKEP
jgi:hypothetical protein